MKTESKKIIIISAIVMILIGGYAYVSNIMFNPKKIEAPKENVTTKTNVSVVNIGAQNIKNITIRNFTFEPRILKTRLGDTVIWSNGDSAPHNIKIGNITSPEMKTNDTFRYKFEKTGTYSYSCGIHPKMVGEIVVE